MNTFLIIITAILGAVTGSFLYVVTVRNSVRTMGGRSACVHCGHTLAAYELIPIISYCIQLGRCRHCGVRLSYQYLVAEITTSALFVWLFVIVHATVVWPVVLLLAIAMQITVVLTWYDIRHFILPSWALNTLTVVAAIIGCMTIGIVPTIIGLAAASPLLLLSLVSRGAWLGFGDVRLGFAIGLLLGLVKGLVAIMISFWIAAILSLLLIGLQRLWHGRANRKTLVPFGPFLLLGMWLVFLFNIGIWDILQGIPFSL